jgi:Ca2+-binding EF-hand superfamily protein
MNKGILMAGLGSLTFFGSAMAQAPAPAAPAAPTRNQGADHSKKELPGPIDSIQDLQDAGKMLFKAADTNNDGQISQKEATDAGNLLVGGFFFRADSNGDGTLSKEEADAARESLFRQQPVLRFVLQKGKMGVQQSSSPAVENAKSTADTLRGQIDTNHDNQLQATELRQAVNLAVEGAYRIADTNQDQYLSPVEINAAIAGVAKMAARTAFQTADADNNGQVSKDEFSKAIVEPANLLFMIFDANSDDQISPQELKTAEQIIAAQLRNLQVPEPPNSLSRMVRSGTSPEQAAAVPNIRTPKENDNQVRPAGTDGTPR